MHCKECSQDKTGNAQNLKKKKKKCYESTSLSAQPVEQPPSQLQAEAEQTIQQLRLLSAHLDDETRCLIQHAGYSQLSLVVTHIPGSHAFQHVTCLLQLFWDWLQSC